jgi:hypothetical protein
MYVRTRARYVSHVCRTNVLLHKCILFHTRVIKRMHESFDDLNYNNVNTLMMIELSLGTELVSLLSGVHERSEPPFDVHLSLVHCPQLYLIHCRYIRGGGGGGVVNVTHNGMLLAQGSAPLTQGTMEYQKMCMTFCFQFRVLCQEMCM